MKFGRSNVGTLTFGMPRENSRLRASMIMFRPRGSARTISEVVSSAPDRAETHARALLREEPVELPSFLEFFELFAGVDGLVVVGLVVVGLVVGGVGADWVVVVAVVAGARVAAGMVVVALPAVVEAGVAVVAVVAGAGVEDS